MLDHPTIFLRGAGQEPRHIHKRQNWDFKRIAKPHEPGRFARTVNIKASREHHGLVRHDADALPL